ncbi:MAG TPA: sugar phosphate isomerase/epimerase [Verrucomicrobiales bacterium]|nr:sugar phosphate isomerase/epimerase [Verrucomicrobiales bacterium]HIL71828.1 sugar phosphate isomerase/epimerase [Verrucomicrobiota bacterium]
MTATSAHGDSHEKPTEGFRYCLNTSTIRGQKLPLDEEIDLIAAAGYSGIEPWIGEIETFKSSGGNLDDLRKRIADHGLTVEDAIGFANWIVDDDAQREKGLEQARRDMDLVHRIGGKRIAAPPVGATKQTDLNLFKAADRYRALLEVGEEVGVVPQVELWGFSSSLSRLGEVLFVAAECGRKDAGVLTDVYHIYKGGSNFNGLKLINGKAMHLMHVNDYPADPPRETINDSHRVYPGDGIAPLGSIFRGLRDSGFQGALSLELFNRSYWEQDAKLVLETGLRKMKEAVAAAFTE